MTEMHQNLFDRKYVKPSVMKKDLTTDFKPLIIIPEKKPLKEIKMYEIYLKRK
jgi:hypothetical protein